MGRRRFIGPQVLQCHIEIRMHEFKLAGTENCVNNARAFSIKSMRTAKTIASKIEPNVFVDSRSLTGHGVTALTGP